MANKNLSAAKDAKNDEFYTELSEIQAELANYPDKFAGKTVFCNCDDPFESNFVKYFLMNFNRLGLKCLLATGYKTSPVGGREIGTKNAPYALRVTDTKKYLVGTQTDLNVQTAKTFLECEGADIMTPLVGNAAMDEDGNPVYETVKEKYTDEKTGKTKTRTVKREVYYEAGDFRSDMSVELLKECDVVVTNPPFSKFREFVAQLIKYEKHFLILGNPNAITYKEFFPLLKGNKVWVGNKSMGRDMLFDVSPEYAEILLKTKKEGSGYRIVNGKVKGRASAIWFTNIDHAKRHQMLPLDLGYTYYGHEDMYPRYDNYDAINVDKVSQIPCDYTGVMGVPISFLDKYCPEQFEIVTFRKGDDGKDLVFTREREREFNRTFASLYDSALRFDNWRETDALQRWEEQVCTDSDSSEDVKMFATHIVNHPELIDAALRERERESTVLLQTLDQSAVRSCQRLHNQREEDVCQDPHQKTLNLFFPTSMPIAGCMNSPEDTKIGGKSKYARICIMRQ